MRKARARPPKISLDLYLINLKNIFETNTNININFFSSQTKSINIYNFLSFIIKIIRFNIFAFKFNNDNDNNNNNNNNEDNNIFHN